MNVFRWLVVLCIAVTATFSLPGTAEAQDAEKNLIVTSLSDISTLDPAIGYDTLSWPALSLVYRGLVSYDAEGTLVPELAESFEVSEDGLVYTFVLREGIMFSNGRAITPEDVKYSFERLLSPETASPGAYMFEGLVGVPEFTAGEAEGISGIEIIDERTVQFTFTNPEWTTLQRMALPFGSIVAREGVEEAGENFARQPLGAGPFVLESWESGLALNFVRNENYWKEGLPLVDRVTIQVGVDPATATLRIEAGEADTSLDVIPGAEYARVAADPALADNLLLWTAFPNVIYLAPNVRDEPLSNVMVRQALSMAIDRERLVNILNNRAVPAAGPVPPTIEGKNTDLAPLPHDPEAARAMLTEAGYPEGFSTEIYTYTVPDLQAVAQAVAQDWNSIGVTTEVVVLDFAPLLDLAFGSPEDMPVLLIDWYLDYQDPSNIYQPLISCAGSFNPGAYCNEELDAVENTDSLLPFGDERWAAYAALEAQLAEELPMIPLYHIDQYYYLSDRLTISAHPAYLINFETAELAE